MGQKNNSSALWKRCKDGASPQNKHTTRLNLILDSRRSQTVRTSPYLYRNDYELYSSGRGNDVELVRTVLDDGVPNPLKRHKGPLRTSIVFCSPVMPFL